MVSQPEKKNVASQPWWADEQFIRANQIARSNRTQTPLIDVAVSTWWRWVAARQAPQPTRLTRGTTVWRKSEVLAFIEAKYAK